MSVKKVKISELKQLSQDTDSSDIFMPAADSNNNTYRVPLSRYDNAKGEADTAAAAANAAAQAAATSASAAVAAAENANAAATRNLAEGIYPGIVRGSKEVIECSEVAPYDVKTRFGNILYLGGVATTRYMRLQTNINLKGIIVEGYDKLDATIWILKGYYIGGWKGSTNYYAIAHIVEKNMIAYDLEDGKTWVCGVTTNMQWVTPAMGVSFTLPVATATTLGGVKKGTNVNIDANGVISVPTASVSTAGVVKGSDTIQVASDGAASVPIATAAQAGVVKVGSGLVMGSDGTLSLGNNTLANITDNLIKQRFSQAYVAYNNSAPAEEVAAVRNVLDYEGTDGLTLAVKYLLQFFRLSFVDYPSGIQPLSNND